MEIDYNWHNVLGCHLSINFKTLASTVLKHICYKFSAKVHHTSVQHVWTVTWPKVWHGCTSRLQHQWGRSLFSLLIICFVVNSISAPINQLCRHSTRNKVQCGLHYN